MSVGDICPQRSKENDYLTDITYLFKPGILNSSLLLEMFWGWHHYLFIYRVFASWHLGKVFRGVYTGDLFPLIRHVLWWIQGLSEKGGGDGEGVNPLVFLCSSLFSTFSLSLQLPPSFIFGNISFSWVRPVMLTKARCSELSLPSPLCPCLCCLWY